MKVIFLDIDGILNTSQTFIDIHNEYVKTGLKRIAIDLDKLNLLKEIVNKTGCYCFKFYLAIIWKNGKRNIYSFK